MRLWGLAKALTCYSAEGVAAVLPLGIIAMGFNQAGRL